MQRCNELGVHYVGSHRESKKGAIILQKISFSKCVIAKRIKHYE